MLPLAQDAERPGCFRPCTWCERHLARRGGSPQRFCGPKCRQAFWSELRRFEEQAFGDGVVSIAASGRSAAACTLRERIETRAPLPDTRPSNFAPAGASMRFSVEVERITVGWLVRLGLIRPDQADDLGAILAGFRNVGLARASSSPALKWPAGSKKGLARACALGDAKVGGGGCWETPVMWSVGASAYSLGENRDAHMPGL